MSNPLMLAALDYESKGFSVIPLKAKDKIPMLASWAEFQERRAEREEIGEWWRTWPNANIGIVTGAVSGLFVIDCDSQEAATSLKPLLGDMTNVGLVATGKGFHLYYRHGSDKIQNKAGIRPHVDFRGDGGYVVAPPSVHSSGKEYKWLKPITDNLCDIPADFLLLMTRPSNNGTKTHFDTAGALAGLPEGQRDQGVFKLACKLRAADVPYEMALELCEQAAANCIPPFREARRKVDQAYKYTPGRSQQSQMSQASLWPELKSAADALIQMPDTERWLWEKCLPIGSCSMLVAKPKVGKSSFAVALSIAVCRGLLFLGRQTRKAASIYLFLDGPMEDIKEQFINAGLTANDELYWHAGIVPDEAAKWATAVMLQAKAKLLVVDTLQKFFKFKDLNDYAEIANTMEPMLRAAQETECHVMFLHHASKFSLDDMDSAIGSSVLKGQAYANLHLKKLPNTDIRILRSEQRGGKNFDEVAIDFQDQDQKGLMVITGTRAQAEIRSVEPVIRQVLDDKAMTETELRETIGARGMLVSLAIRAMLKRGELETTGTKRSRVDPLKYHLSSDLINHERGRNV